MPSTAEFELELKSDANKIWESINDLVNVFPKAFPQVFEKVELVKGDGKSVGSIRSIIFGSGPFKILTEGIDFVDDETKTMSYSYVDGDGLKIYKSFKATFVVSDKSDGAVVKYSCECEKLSEKSPDPSAISDFLAKIVQGLDAYLLSLEAHE